MTTKNSNQDNSQKNDVSKQASVLGSNESSAEERSKAASELGKKSHGGGNK